MATRYERIRAIAEAQVLDEVRGYEHATPVPALPARIDRLERAVRKVQADSLWGDPERAAWFEGALQGVAWAREALTEREAV